MADPVQDLVRVFGLAEQQELAALLGYTKNAPSNWKREGFSAHARWRIQQKARELNLELPESFFDDSRRPTTEDGEAA